MDWFYWRPWGHFSVCVFFLLCSETQFHWSGSTAKTLQRVHWGLFLVQQNNQPFSSVLVLQKLIRIGLVQKASIKEGSSRILWVYNRRGSRYFILVLHCFPINLYNFEFDISDGPKLDKRIYLRLSHPEGAILLPQLENRFTHSIKRQSMILEIQEGCRHVRPWLAKLPRRATLRGLCTEADVYYAWSVRSIVRHHCLLALLSRLSWLTFCWKPFITGYLPNTCGSGPLTHLHQFPPG